MPRLRSDSRHIVRFTLNGRSVAAEAEPRMLLTDFLRHTVGLTGTHVGCEHGVCGACTIQINGRRAHADPSEPELREYLAGHLCRCTGYAPIIAAALDAAQKLRREGTRRA